MSRQNLCWVVQHFLEKCLVFMRRKRDVENILLLVISSISCETFAPNLVPANIYIFFFTLEGPSFSLLWKGRQSHSLFNTFFSTTKKKLLSNFLAYLKDMPIREDLFSINFFNNWNFYTFICKALFSHIFLVISRLLLSAKWLIGLKNKLG